MLYLNIKFLPCLSRNTKTKDRNILNVCIMDFEFDNEILINIGLAIAAIAFLLLFIYGINRLFNFIYKKINSLTGDKIKGLRLKKYQF